MPAGTPAGSLDGISPCRISVQKQLYLHKQIHGLMREYDHPQMCIKAFLSFFILGMLSISLHGQVNVTFNVDMKSLADSGYFLDGDRLLVRGSFNGWAGNQHELSPGVPGSYHYTVSFDIAAEPGDTIQYKFVVLSKESKEYWEAQPDPANPDYGNRMWQIREGVNKIPEAVFDFGPDLGSRGLSQMEKFRQDFVQMRTLLEDNHPALYDYTDKGMLDSLFDYYYAQIGDETDYSTFYKYVSTILAHIGCGHTKLFIPGAYWGSKPDHFFPLQLLINTGEVLVRGFYGDVQGIPVGSQLTAINGMPVDSILEEMLPFESSDGFIHSFKIHSIERRFPEKYALMYGFPEEFSIDYIPPDGAQVENILLKPAGFGQFMAVFRSSKELSMTIPEGYDAAIITINTFGYYSEVPMFRAFIDSCFLVMKDQDISNLIIDLRGNDGGDPYCASYLFSYLEKEPVPYFIEAYPHYDTLAKPVPLAENHYIGKVFVLIDGGGFSTNGHFCSLLKYHGLVTFVGTDLGATFTCTGNVMYPTLDHTQLFLGTARERRYSAAVEGMDPRKPIVPDYFVEMSGADLAAGRDGQLEYVLENAERIVPR